MKSDRPFLGAAVEAADPQRALVLALMNPAAFPHPVKEIRLIETHISYVLLTGHFAYKIKKAVNLGFLDFSSLAQRRFCCDEELRVNRRLVPELYLAVVSIGASPGGIAIDGAGEPLEYAVKMREFPQTALLDLCLSEGSLSPVQIDLLAERVAEFHGQIARAGAGDEHGTPASVWRPMSETFKQLRETLPVVDGDASDLRLLNELETWSHDEHARLQGVLSARRHDGFVRECHGDLHLGNIAWLNGAPQIFDGIEFNANLRWIDVMNEVAFLIMDLDERGRPDYACRFLNRYLDVTGDYAGLQLLPFYRVNRALVRANVACIRAAQEGAPAGQAQAAICKQYLACARRAMAPRARWLLLMHGLSGAGKSTLALHVAEHSGALCVRSDIERKRLCGLPERAHRPADGADSGIYDAETTRATYLCLVQLARQVLDAGFPVVVDAASLKFWQREIFRSQARAQGVRFRLLSCRAAETILQARLLARKQGGSDASDADVAVLRQQLQSSEPLTDVEQAAAWFVDSGDEALERELGRITRELGQIAQEPR